jgi:hypothetical protein
LRVYDKGMFEGKMPSARAMTDSTDLSADNHALREMTWSDLRARLEAARDLHDSMQAGTRDHLASFDAHSARRIAALAEGKHDVNPDGLANGKGNGSIDAASPDAGFGTDPRK